MSVFFLLNQHFVVFSADFPTIQFCNTEHQYCISSRFHWVDLSCVEIGAAVAFSIVATGYNDCQQQMCVEMGMFIHTYAYGSLPETASLKSFPKSNAIANASRKNQDKKL